MTLYQISKGYDATYRAIPFLEKHVCMHTSLLTENPGRTYTEILNIYYDLNKYVVINVKVNINCQKRNLVS